MNDEEKRGCIELLNSVEDSDLRHLFDTVTNRKLLSGDKSEMIEAICLYSDSAVELLKRKKMKNELLAKYLMSQKVRFQVHAEKTLLIDHVINFWNSRTLLQMQNVTDCDKKQTGKLPASHYPEKSTDIQHVQEANSDLPQTSLEHTEITGHCRSAPSGTLVKDQRLLPEQTHKIDDTRLLGETFATWFYKMMNSQNPATPNPPEEFGPFHFWNDVSLQLICITYNHSSDTFHGAELTAQRLLALVKDEQLLFNPNISKEGILVKSNPHGMLMVIVCGTLHRGNDCLGIFEQMFGLVRDPRLDNNWKIKVTKLKIISSEVSSKPKITDISSSEIQDLVAI